MGGAIVYVSVFAKFDKDGNVTPMWLEWVDGTIYEVDRIVDKKVQKKHSLHEKVSYLVQIGRKTARLSYEDERWFVNPR